MASNTNTLKRLEVKYVRDGIKSRYPKRSECAICGTTNDLELHHYSTVNLLWEKWKADNGVTIEDAAHIMLVREDFYTAHAKELLVDVVTLCNTHHKKLHAIYGKEPLLTTAPKQIRWVQIQKEKLDVRET